MIPLMNFQERALNGPVMKSDDFDLAFSSELRDLVSNYDIKYNPEELIVDDATADAVFMAGVDLLADVGLYHLDTHRVIKYSREEILEFVNERKQHPGRAVFGLGDDEMTLAYRTGDDTRSPTLYAGSWGAVDEELFIPLAQSFAQEEMNEGLGISCGLARLGNIEAKAGTLSEIHVGLWEQRQLQEVLRRVGRPGLNMGLLSTVSTVGAIMECIRPGLREAHNTQIGVHILPEQKLDWNRLLLSHFCEDRGIIPWQSAMSMIGGLCRDAADAAVSLVANMLGQMSYAHGPTCSLFPNHLDGSWASRETNWAVSAAARASERNIRLAIGSAIAGISQADGTPFGFLQAAASATVYTSSGLSYAWVGGGTGLEARFIGEIMNVKAGMDAAKANELAKAIMVKVDERISQVSGPVLFYEKYDIKKVKPKAEYEAGLLAVKEELASIGMPY